MFWPVKNTQKYCWPKHYRSQTTPQAMKTIVLKRVSDTVGYSKHFTEFDCLQKILRNTTCVLHGHQNFWVVQLLKISKLP